MTSDKRKFDNFKSFSGKINKDTDMYEFPTLYTTDKSKNKREWSIFVRLIKSSSKKSFKNVNWALTGEVQVSIKSEYLDDAEIPSGIISEVWTESGITNKEITRSAPTYPTEKNIGRSNYRNYFKQALILARGKYLKKIDEGGIVYSDVGKEISTIHAKYFPMLAKNYKDYIKKHNLVWPIFVQPKLDGIRCISYLHLREKTLDDATTENIIMYTRKKKDYPNNDFNNSIKKQLLPILKKYYGKYAQGESIYLDGELYSHGMKLQKINHFMRTEDLKSDSADDQVQYWIYDIFSPSKKLIFKERANILKSLKANFGSLKNIRMTETLEIENQDTLDKQYSKYIVNNYEGMMIRSANGIYSTSAKGSTGLRSQDLLKRKEVFSDEYEVVGWTQGTAGKETGAIIWICQTKDKKKFNVTPNEDYKERYKIYKECQNDFINKYANRLLTVEYRGKSEDNIPQHAKGIMFRDIE